MEKNNIRLKIIEKRNKLDFNIKKKYDRLIFEQLIKNNIYKEAKKIFTYISFGSEVDTIEFINYALKDNKEIYVPKTDKIKKEMIAIRIDNFNDMVIDKWGILEPTNIDKDKIDEEFDLIIMPGIAFDKSGNRIGYGGGYYDKYISNKNIKCFKIALAYDFQIIEKIYPEVYDVRVDALISNNDFIKI